MRHWQLIRVRFPGESLGVEPLLEAGGAVHPGAVAVGEGRPVIELAPHQETAGGLLDGVAIGRIVTFVLQTGSYFGGDKIVHGLEAEHIGAGGWLGCRRGGRDPRQGERLDGVEDDRLGAG